MQHDAEFTPNPPKIKSAQTWAPSPPAAGQVLRPKAVSLGARNTEDHGLKSRPTKANSANRGETANGACFQIVQTKPVTSVIQGQLLAVTISPANHSLAFLLLAKTISSSRRAIGIKRSWDEISPSREERTLGGSPATASGARRRKSSGLFSFPGITRHPQTRRRSCSARLCTLCAARPLPGWNAPQVRAQTVTPETLRLSGGLGAPVSAARAERAVGRPGRDSPRARARRRRPHLAGRGRGGPGAGLPEGSPAGWPPPRRQQPGAGRSPGTGRAARGGRLPGRTRRQRSFGPPRPGARPAALTSGGPARRARRTRRRRRRLRSLCLGTSLPSPLRAQPERSRTPARAGRGGACGACPPRAWLAPRRRHRQPRAARAAERRPLPVSRRRAPAPRAPLGSPARRRLSSQAAPWTPASLKGPRPGCEGASANSPSRGTVPREDRPGSGGEAGRPRSPRALRMPRGHLPRQRSRRSPRG